MRWAARAALVALGASGHALAEPSEVLIQAGPVARRGLSRDDSVAGTVISGSALRTPGIEAADLLRGLPGLTVIDTGGFGALSTASIRGATSAQTPVYLAGVRINDDVGGTADLSTIPLALVERVEVYRGHAPPQADRLAIGGALFFDPRRALRTGASATLSAGSFGLRSARATLALAPAATAPSVAPASTAPSVAETTAPSTAGTAPSAPAPWGLMGSLSTQSATNDYAYRDDRGTLFDGSDDRSVRRRNADTGTRDLWLLGHGRLGPRTRVLALAHGITREQGVPGLGLLPTRAARASFRRTLGAIRGEHRCAEERCAIDLTTSALLSDASFDDPLRELSFGGTAQRSRASRVEQSVFTRGQVTERLALHGGLDLAVERLAQSVDDRAPSSASRRFSRVALGGTWSPREDLDLIGLGALECNGVEGSALCDLPVEAGRVGVRWRIEELELLAHAGRYGRAPTLGEQRGISATVRGNPTLRPERGLLVDSGLRHGGIVAGIPVALEVFAFAQWISELILYQRSSLGFLRPYNAGDTRTLGLEVAARAAPWRWLLAELALTALDPRDTSATRVGSNDLLPFRSRLQAAPALVIRPGGWARWGLDETTLEARYVHQSSRYADGSGQVVLPAQGSLDLEVSALWWHRRLGLRGRAANVLDQVRSDVIGFPLPGRSFFFSLELSWP